MISILSTAKRPIFDSIKSTLSICAVNKRNASHTDIVFPNFDDYRLESVKNPTGSEASESVDDRRGTPSAIVYGGFFYFIFNISGSIPVYISYR